LKSVSLSFLRSSVSARLTIGFPQDRRKLINDAFREQLYEYVGGTLRGHKGHLIEIGGVEDHVHLLANLSPVLAVADVIRNVKANASKWVNELPRKREKFNWKVGYSAFSVSYSGIEPVCDYIRNQQEHHRTVTFKEEYIQFLERHGIGFDSSRLFEDEHVG